MTVRSENSGSHPPYALVIAAFLAVYLIWGSTYLAIKFAIAVIPPFLMAGVRYVIAALVLSTALRLQGVKRPAATAANWRAAATVGILMLVGGNGFVTFAEQYIASGLAALLIATVPLWLVAFDWLFCRGPRPTPLIVAGLFAGLFGVYLLIGPSHLAGERANPIGAGFVLAACVFWAAGSLYSRRAPLPASALTATWMEMLAGGLAMIVIGSVTGEWSRFDLASITLRSVLCVLYLSIFGSIVALTAYTWLLKVSTPARVGTYAYVNPVIAMVLGAIFAGENLSPRVIVAAFVILTAVLMITLARSRSAGVPTTRSVKRTRVLIAPAKGIPAACTDEPTDVAC